MYQEMRLMNGEKPYEDFHLSQLFIPEFLVYIQTGWGTAIRPLQIMDYPRSEVTFKI